MTSATVYDLLGLGFGPANIAIAGAIVESWSDHNSSLRNVLFVEKHHVFRWHPGMLLPGAKMQLDLATLRNPGSPITFLSYLHSEGRLTKFINRGGTIPTRKEYADYIGWAARFVQSQGIKVNWGTEILGLDDGKDGTIHVHAKDLKTGQVTIHRTRNLIIAPGGGPNIPRTLEAIYQDPLVIHSSQYATSINSILERIVISSDPLRIAVVGSGQSAAEVTLNLQDRLSSIPVSGGRHRIEMVIQKGSIKPSDDTSFSNEIFDPESTETWFSIPSLNLRAAQLKEYKTTNYGVVNPRTIDALYEVMYDQQVDETISSRPDETEATYPLIVLRPYHTVASATRSNDGRYLFSYRHGITGASFTETYDAVICATGYQRTAWIDLLKTCEIGRHFGLDANTESSKARLAPETELHHHPQSQTSTSSVLYVSRNYRLLPRFSNGDAFKPKVYVQGVEEASHGLSDTLLSVMGIRAGEVVEDLLKHDRIKTKL